MIVRTISFLSLAIVGACAFSTPLKRSSISMIDLSSINLPNPFAAKPEPTPKAIPLVSNAFDPSPEGLILRAKAVVVADLGIQDESLLDNNFIWIGPQLGSQVLGKSDYLAAGKFFDLRSAFPDWDYRAHDYRIDSENSMTVRLTARTVGTMRGELRLRSEVLPPNGQALSCPPEAISITFSDEGKVTKLCSGFVMDRLVGNTGGLCGVMAAATIGGAPPTDWEVYPPTTVLARLIGRPVPQLTDVGSFLAPFPENVMIQLAKGIFAANMAIRDPDLLGTGFTFCGPFVGPVDKKTFLTQYATTLFGGVEPKLSHFRVDPYDPYRVWVDIRAVGIVNGMKIDVAPQATSFTFDDYGVCIRLTAGAVMDPSIGNSGGLAGVEGARYAAGTADLDIFTRPLPQGLARFRKRLLEPVTKIGVDDYTLSQSVFAVLSAPDPRAIATTVTEADNISTLMKESPLSAIVNKAAAPSFPFLPQLTSSETDDDVSVSVNDEKAVSRKRSQVEAVFQKVKAEASAKQIQLDQSRENAEALRKQVVEEKAAAKQLLAREQAVADVKRKKESMMQQAEDVKAKKKAVEEAKTVVAKQKQEAIEAKLKAKLVKLQAVEQAKVTASEVQRKLDEAKAANKQAAEKSKAAALLSKEKAEKTLANKLAADKARIAAVEANKKIEEIASAKKLAAETAKAAAVLSKQKELQAAIEAIRQAEEAKRKSMTPRAVKPTPVSRGTRPVKPSAKATSFFFASPILTTVTTPSAPRGIPTLIRWKKNRDGSITGLITGSNAFDEKTLVTTSVIVNGDISAGEVVQTKSGSKYFLI